MNKKITIGKFGKPYGIKGWLYLHSYTNPKENIFNYTPWLIYKDKTWQEITITDSKPHADSIIIKLANIEDRESTKIYTNLKISIETQQLPNLPADEYYWHQLEGLTVIDQTDTTLGTVSQLLATGSNDILVVKNGETELLIPYLDATIRNVDLAKQTITVDWEE